jgi:hypothetical protein
LLARPSHLLLRTQPDHHRLRAPTRNGSRALPRTPRRCRQIEQWLGRTSPKDAGEVRSLACTAGPHELQLPLHFPPPPGAPPASGPCSSLVGSSASSLLLGHAGELRVIAGELDPSTATEEVGPGTAVVDLPPSSCAIEGGGRAEEPFCRKKRRRVGGRARAGVLPSIWEGGVGRRRGGALG